MFLTDRVSVGAVRRTGDGYLVADAKVARTGIQLYTGAELGRPDLDIVRVYRPESEVFARDSLASYAHKPATNDHPARMVSADTWKADAIGQIGEEVVRDGDHVRVPLILMDGAAIKDYEAGKREVSMGYSAEIVFADGVTPEGEAYDALQKDIRINHIALVRKGRAGTARIGDRRAPGAQDRGANNPPTEKSTMSNTNTRTVMVDGLSVETTDAGAQAIGKLQTDLEKAKKAFADAENAHTAAIAAKDAQIAKLEAERDDLKGKVLTDAALDARVQARADLLATAKAIHDADYTGKSDAEVRKAVVVAKLGDAAVAGKSEAYLDARFDILVEDAKKDPVARALRDGTSRVPANDAASAEQAAYQRYLDSFNRKKEA